MTIYEIIRCCLFMLGKEDVANDLGEIKPDYEAYMEAVNADLSGVNVLFVDGQEVNTVDEITNRLDQYNDAIYDLEDENNIVVVFKFIANKVLKLISSNYLPCRIKEKISVANGVFELNNLSKKFMAVKSIKEEYSNESMLHYDVVGNKLYLPTGDYIIDYIYSIEDYDYFENITDFAPILTYSNVVDGVLGEYYILNGFYEEADFYITRFESQMNAVNRKTNEIRVKERVWA